jgi:hypothetical protein
VHATFPVVEVTVVTGVVVRVVVGLVVGTVVGEAADVVSAVPDDPARRVRARPSMRRIDRRTMTTGARIQEKRGNRRFTRWRAIETPLRAWGRPLVGLQRGRAPGSVISGFVKTP